MSLEVGDSVWVAFLAYEAAASLVAAWNLAGGPPASMPDADGAWSSDQLGDALEIQRRQALSGALQNHWPSPVVAIPDLETGLAAPTPTPAQAPQVLPQKMRGLYALRKFDLPGNLNDGAHYFIKTREEIPSQYALAGGREVFGRGCPLFPRHGFVDSKILHSEREIFEYWDAMKGVDPDATMVLAPVYPDLSHNAILTPNSLAIGPGNAGATDGQSITFRVPPVEWKPKLLEEAGITESPYAEVIYVGNGRPLVVQLRNGPAVDALEKFIPPGSHTCQTVREIAPGYNLLAWEKECKNMAPGTFVRGQGMSAVSHAGVHCVINNIPFFGGAEAPEIGRTYVNEKRAPQFSRREFRAGVLLACQVEKAERQVAQLAFAILHSWAYLQESAPAARLLGWALMIVARYGQAFTLGELRHAQHIRRGSWPAPLRKYLGKTRMRTAVYGKVLKSAFPKVARHGVHGHLTGFSWIGGYGGPLWAGCAYLSYECGRLAVRSARRSGGYLSQEEVAGLVGVLNRTVNAAHNGGSWFNKVLANSDMDMAAHEPASVFVKVGAALHGLVTAEPKRRRLPVIPQISEQDLRNLRICYGLEDPDVVPTAEQDAEVPCTSASYLEKLKLQARTFDGRLRVQIVHQNGVGLGEVDFLSSQVFPTAAPHVSTAGTPATYWRDGDTLPDDSAVVLPVVMTHKAGKIFQLHHAGLVKQVKVETICQCSACAPEGAQSSEDTNTIGCPYVGEKSLNDISITENF